MSEAPRSEDLERRDALVRKHPDRAELAPVSTGQSPWRSSYATEHAGSTWTVDVDYFDIGERMWLYRDGQLVDRQASPATFRLPGGALIEAELALYGMKRAHLVLDGESRRLEPVSGTWEHARLDFARRHPAASTAVSVLSFAVLAFALVAGLPQLYELLSGTDWWQGLTGWGRFHSPWQLPGWANTLLGVAGIAAGLERGASMRHNTWLDD